MARMAPALRYAKALVAAAAAALITLNEVLPETGGVIGEQWLNVAIAVAAAAGVYQTPNKPR